MTYLFQFREPFSAWSHGLWLLLTLPATLVLWRRCGNDRAKRLSLMVFGGSMAACYLGSTLYHSVRLEKEGIDLFDRLDHVGIHLLIAGSYTPVAWNLMRGRWRWGTLAAVWLTTLVGSGLILANIRLPVPLQTCEYLAMGWGALLVYFEVARELTHRRMRPLVLGGVLYSVGAVLNLIHWPVLWPGVFGSHEMFHLWVMAGTSAHFWFMLTAVAPYALAARAEAQPVRAWDDGRRQPPRVVLEINPFSGRFRQD
jgi:hemolysin III